MHNKPIGEDANLSSLEGVQSQNDPTDELALHPFIWLQPFYSKSLLYQHSQSI
jgi:hypothetical protein